MLTPAGRINKLFGTQGGVMISLYGVFPRDFATSTPLFITVDALDVPIFCDAFERRGQSGAVVTFADFDSERRASELLGREFRMEIEQEDNDEFYMEDLIGFSVKAGKLNGKITDYIDSDANPLFEVQFGSSTVLIPAAEEFIAHIDFKKRIMKLVLPDGLIDIQL